VEKPRFGVWCIGFGKTGFPKLAIFGILLSRIKRGLEYTKYLRSGKWIKYERFVSGRDECVECDLR
jgi:hypothetical protein